MYAMRSFMFLSKRDPVIVALHSCAYGIEKAADEQFMKLVLTIDILLPMQ